MRRGDVAGAAERLQQGGHVGWRHGGAGNIASTHSASSRLRLELKDPAAVDDAALRALGVRGLARPSPKVLHLILGPSAEAAGEGLKAAVA